MSQQKIEKAFDVNENEILLTSDTIVALDQKFFSNPKMRMKLLK